MEQPYPLAVRKLVLDVTLVLPAPERDVVGVESGVDSLVAVIGVIAECVRVSGRNGRKDTQTIDRPGSRDRCE